MKKTIEQIKRLSDKDSINVNSRSVYESDEWGMNRMLTTKSDGIISVKDLKQMVNELKVYKTCMRNIKIIGTEDENTLISVPTEQVYEIFHKTDWKDEV